jgi:pimeloyl-ACP methyl ester carboxylesterase
MIRSGIEYTPGSETHFIQGRYSFRLAVEVTGDGYPVIFCHGVPGGRLGAKPDVPGARLFTYDRRGYGYSTRIVDRSVADEVGEIRAIARYFNLKKFGLVARSGGAPFALAAAAHMDEVEKIALVVPLGPRTLMDDTWWEGMGSQNTRIFGAIVAPEIPPWMLPSYVPKPDPYDAVMEEFKEFARIIQQRARGAGGCKPNEPDHERGIFANSLIPHSAALKFGSAGRLDDFCALLNHWGFDIDAVTQPTEIWVAGNADIYTPSSHGRFIAAQLGACLLHEMPEASHDDGVPMTTDAIKAVIP